MFSILVGVLQPVGEAIGFILEFLVATVQVLCLLGALLSHHGKQLPQVVSLSRNGGTVPCILACFCYRCWFAKKRASILRIRASFSWVGERVRRGKRVLGAGGRKAEMGLGRGRDEGKVSTDSMIDQE